MLTMHEHGESGGRSRSAAAQAAAWDSRYSDGDGTMWSGQPNGRLVAEVTAMVPGRALDVGCGEGADAIWLAERGWVVTAIDVSGVAIARAREEAERAGVTIEWVVDDIVSAAPPAGPFDLVSMQYPALPKVSGAAAVQRVLHEVDSGGVVLAVYHDLDEAHREHMKSQGTDPADYIGIEELLKVLSDGFTIETHAVAPRVDPPPGAHHIADVVLRARKR